MSPKSEEFKEKLAALFSGRPGEKKNTSKKEEEKKVEENEEEVYNHIKSALANNLISVHSSKEEELEYEDEEFSVPDGMLPEDYFGTIEEDSPPPTPTTNWDSEAQRIYEGVSGGKRLLYDLTEEEEDEEEEDQEEVVKKDDDHAVKTYKKVQGMNFEYGSLPRAVLTMQQW